MSATSIEEQIWTKAYVYALPLMSVEEALDQANQALQNYQQKWINQEKGTIVPVDSDEGEQHPIPGGLHLDDDDLWRPIPGDLHRDFHTSFFDEDGVGDFSTQSPKPVFKDDHQEVLKPRSATATYGPLETAQYVHEKSPQSLSEILEKHPPIDPSTLRSFDNCFIENSSISSEEPIVDFFTAQPFPVNFISKDSNSLNGSSSNPDREQQ